MLNLRNYWYIACSSDLLGVRGTRRSNVLGIDLLVHRLGTGDVEVTARSFESSEQNLYWSDKNAGTLPTVEKHGYIWVWIGNTAPAECKGVPDFADHFWTQLTNEVDIAAEKIMEINLDYAHLKFVHKTHPATLAYLQGGAFRFVQSIVDSGESLASFPESVEEISGDQRKCTLDDPGLSHIPDQSIIFTLPDRIKYGISLNGETRHFYIYSIPTGERTTRLETLISTSSEEAAFMGDKKVRWLNIPNTLLEEDLEVLRNINSPDEGEGIRELFVTADALVIKFRDFIRRAEKGTKSAQISTTQYEFQM